jgi:hypothetical protein
MFHEFVRQPDPSALASNDFPSTAAYTAVFVADDVRMMMPLLRAETTLSMYMHVCLYECMHVCIMHVCSYGSTTHTYL